MDGDRGRRRALAAGILLVLLACAGAAYVVLADPEPGAPPVVAADVHRETAPGAAPAPPEFLSRPTTRPRVHVGREEHDEAEADAQRRLDELARLRKDLAERLAGLGKGAGAAAAAGAQPGAARQPVVPEARSSSGVVREGQLKDGLQDGFWVETFESGARIETEYRMGVEHGRHAAWNPDGSPRFVGEFEDGEMSGTWTAWHANGQLLSTRQFVAGKVEGLMRTFHENGVLAEESTFVAGQEVGVNRGWHPGGGRAWEIVYVDGEREGPAVWWDAEGNLSAEGRYDAGALHGQYIEYSPDGTVKSTERWDHGRRVASAE